MEPLGQAVPTNEQINMFSVHVFCDCYLESIQSHHKRIKRVIIFCFRPSWAAYLSSIYQMTSSSYFMQLFDEIDGSLFATNVIFSHDFPIH